LRRAVLVEPEKIVIEEVERPKPGEGEVLIRVEVCGICGSDIHMFHGTHPFVKPPIVQGHEFSGVVEEIGPGVSRIEVGKRVTVEPSLICGRCYNCLRGRYNICNELRVLGAQADGAFAEYIAVPERTVYEVPENMSFEEGALVEPLSVAVHAVERSSLEVGNNVVILGAGPIGLLITQVARVGGADRIVVTDLYERRLELAREFGADITINAKREDPVEVIHEELGRDGVDIVFEAVGVEATINQAIEMVRKGAEIVVVGVYGKSPQVKMGLIQDREIVVKGVLMYAWNYPTAIRLIGERRVDVMRLITHRYPLTELEEAYRLLDREKEKTLKVMIYPQLT